MEVLNLTPCGSPGNINCKSMVIVRCRLWCSNWKKTGDGDVDYGCGITRANGS
jgi:hypothetical protein